MAVKRHSPHNGRAPSVIQDVEASGNGSVVLIGEEQEKNPPTRNLKSRVHVGSDKGKSLKLPWDIVLAVLTWYIVGVGHIVTAKMLLMKEYGLHPLVLTFQQLFVGSTLLRLYLGFTGGIQPLPENKTAKPQSLYYDFVLAGLFNALDFLASNTSFSHSSAAFVETIKAAEPLTTTAIALFFGIDTLSFNEGISMCILIFGVFLSTMANATEDSSAFSSSSQESFHQSVKTCAVVMTANLCFALRAKSQKLFRAHPEGKTMDDANLLMRMQQIGAMSLFMPLMIFELPSVLDGAMNAEWVKFCHYSFLAITNAACFSTYCLASCYVLSKLSVIQYTGFNCLRRMFGIIFTSIVFGVPITVLGAFGIILVFTGFLRLQNSRQKDLTQQAKLSTNNTIMTPQSPRRNIKRVLLPQSPQRAKI